MIQHFVDDTHLDKLGPYLIEAFSIRDLGLGSSITL